MPAPLNDPGNPYRSPVSQGEMELPVELPAEVRRALHQHIRSIQIIVAALVVGCLSFLGIVVFVIDAPAQPVGAGDGLVITLAAVGMAAVNVALRFFLPTAIANAARRKISRGTWKLPAAQPASPKLRDFLETTGDAGKLMLVLMARTLLATALLEGAAFLAIIAYMVEGPLFALALAIGLVVGVACHFPSRSSVIRWIASQLKLIDGERLMAE